MKPTSFSILLIFALATLIGIVLAPQLAVKIKPSHVQPTLNISCFWRNANAETVEKQITSVLEGSLNTLHGIKSIKSITQDGGCKVTLAFTDETDIFLTRHEAASILRNIYPSLPGRASYPSLSVQGESAEKRPFITYSLLTSLPKGEVQELGREELLPRITELAGVSNASIYGAERKRWHVHFDRKLMEALHITPLDLQRAIRSTSIWHNLGTVPHQNGQKYTILTTQEPQSWLTLPVAAVEGKTIYFKDIASIKLEDIPPRSYYRINGLHTINLAITPGEGANQVSLAKKIKEIVADTEKQWAGKATFILKKDNSEFIEEETNKIITRSALTLLILFVFTWLVSWNGRYLVIICLSIFANISIAFLVYYASGVELHLYSFAGITVSLGIIIDNSIVMVDHLRHKNNRRVFMALLASTLTTISSLSVIFLLSERLVLNMLDFAIVIIVNLSVSLLIALFLIPALMEKIPLRKKPSRRKYRRKKLVYWFTIGYERVLRFMNRFKWAFFVLLILGFGLPVYMLPAQLGNEQVGYLRKPKPTGELSVWQEAYNNTIGSDFYNEHLRMPINCALGGTLRLFTEKVNHSHYFESKERTNLVVTAQMPVGATLEQMNEAYSAIEQYLVQFPEIDRFETFIYGLESARMVINFKEKYEFSAFPFLLKDLLIQKANEVGSADWQVVGQGDGFNNSIRERTGANKIELYGYNYEQLYRYAELLKETILANKRVQEVNLMGRNSWYRDNNYIYVLKEDDERIGLKQDNFLNIYDELKNFATTGQWLGNFSMGRERYDMVMTSVDAPDFNTWNLQYNQLATNKASHKMHFVSTIEKRRVPEVISRIDQQYFLILEYDFIGPNQLSEIHLEETMENFTPKLPVGYRAERQSRRLKREGKNEQIYMVLLVITIIYFVCAILFESLLQPLAVIGTIPIAFIGVFLSFYWFELNFDQGGFAAFILLSGLTVNSALFIINDMNNYRTGYMSLSGKLKMKTYLKAFNGKIIPILLAILSTVVGLSPYLYLGQQETFWFPLAVGTSGGLIFSLIAIYFYLPLFFTTGDRKNFRPLPLFGRVS